MDVTNKLFHGINLTNYCPYIGDLTDLDVFEEIIQSGYIYTRDDLMENHIELSLNTSFCQSTNEVCLAAYPEDKTMYNVPFNYSDDAFYDFVRICISFIFSKEILIDRQYRIFGMPGEVRIKNSIMLRDNLLAVGFFDKINYTINKMEEEKINKHNPYYHDLLFGHISVEQYVIDEKKKYQFIKKLLKENNYGIPIIDPLSGIDINEDINSEIKRLDKVLKKHMR